MKSTKQKLRSHSLFPSAAPQKLWVAALQKIAGSILYQLLIDEMSRRRRPLGLAPWCMRLGALDVQVVRRRPGGVEWGRFVWPRTKGFRVRCVGEVPRQETGSPCERLASIEPRGWRYLRSRCHGFSFPMTDLVLQVPLQLLLVHLLAVIQCHI